MLPSIFDIFKIGIGPSSSHTLGALNCAKAFINELKKEVINKNDSDKNNKLNINNTNNKNNNFKFLVELMGSFALTGIGHLTHYAIVAGLANYKIDVKKSIKEKYNEINKKKFIKINSFKINFDPENDILFINENINLKHPNTVIFKLLKENKIIYQSEYISIGGGNIKKIDSITKIKLNENIINSNNKTDNELLNINNFQDIIDYCNKNRIDPVSFSIMYHKNIYNINQTSLKKRLKNIWNIMQNVIENGLNNEGILPGKLHLKRRAKNLYTNFLKSIRTPKILSTIITLATIYGIAVSEENASGSIIITSPTCGSAGVLPAVLKTLKEKFLFSDEKIIEALIIAGLIGVVIFKNGSISGAEVGCQGEIGSASSMAAAAAAYLLGGTLQQIEYASEIALEHHLGLTCDPVEELVQIPCIERNGVGAVTALNAANIALLTNENHHISFDKAVIAMKETGLDMNNKYKETSLGGLARICKC